MKSTYMKEPEPFRIIKGKNLKFYAHFHQQVEIVYCISGEIQVIIDGMDYILQEGDVGLVFPNRHHYYPQMQGDKNNEVYLLLFYPAYTEDYCYEWINKLPNIPVIRKEQLPEFFHELWHQFYDTFSVNTDLPMFKAYVSLLTAYMMPLLKLHLTRAQSEYKGNEQDAMQALLNYIDKHFTEDITMKGAAKELGLSPTVLSRIFTKNMGTNFKNHVNTLRISYAKRMLRSSNYSINEISFLSGFQSKRTFFRNFQEMCGQTPSEYREIIRK